MRKDSHTAAPATSPAAPSRAKIPAPTMAPTPMNAACRTDRYCLVGCVSVMSTTSLSPPGDAAEHGVGVRLRWVGCPGTGDNVGACGTCDDSGDVGEGADGGPSAGFHDEADRGLHLRAHGSGGEGTSGQILRGHVAE